MRVTIDFTPPRPPMAKPLPRADWDHIIAHVTKRLACGRAQAHGIDTIVIHSLGNSGKTWFLQQVAMEQKDNYDVILLCGSKDGEWPSGEGSRLLQASEARNAMVNPIEHGNHVLILVDDAEWANEWDMAYCRSTMEKLGRQRCQCIMTTGDMRKQSFVATRSGIPIASASQVEIVDE